MYTKPTKKMLIINILDILRKYTDENHRLSQKEIIDILENEYDMKAERKSIKRNLMNLIDFGYDIEFSESTRLNKSGEEETLYTDWYLRREFEDSELHLLIDNLVFTKSISRAHCKELIDKIEGLSNIYFKSRTKNVHNLPESLPENKQLFYTIEVLDEAISKGKQVQFTYNYYDIDKKMHARCDADNHPRTYIMNPYQLVATNGRYYLICNNDKYDNLSNYRIDYITDIQLLKHPAKKISKVSGAKNGLNLSEHMAEHIYMFAGNSIHVKLRAKRYLITDIIDWFGKDIRFTNASDDEVDVSLSVNEKAIFYWAMQFGEHIKILEPQSLINSIRTTAQNVANQYNDSTSVSPPHN